MGGPDGDERRAGTETTCFWFVNITRHNQMVTWVMLMTLAPSWRKEVRTGTGFKPRHCKKIIYSANTLLSPNTNWYT